MHIVSVCLSVCLSAASSAFSVARLRIPTAAFESLGFRYEPPVLPITSSHRQPEGGGWVARSFFPLPILPSQSA